MVAALFTGLLLAADAPPIALTLEVGLVRVTPRRPGTDQTWIIPAEKRKQEGGGLCGVAAAGMAMTGVGVPFAGMAKTLCDTASSSSPAAPAQARIETSPDIYVRLTASRMMLRSYTVPRTLSNTFRWRAVVPVAAIPKTGLVVEVLNDDGGPDEDGREVIGQARLAADKLVAAATEGTLITVADNGVEKLELLVERAATSPRRKTQALDVKSGIAVIDNFPVLAGEVVEVQARGEYRVAGRAAPVPPAGGAGAATRTFTDGPFKTGAPGAALFRVGKRRLVTGALVTPCAALLSPYEGFLFTGINNQDPAKAQGDLEFDITVRPATEDEWRTGSASECAAAASPAKDDREPLAAFVANAVRRLEGDPGLAAAVLRNTHPSGRDPSLRSIEVDPASDAGGRVFVTVDWRGGVLGGAYSTRIAWEFNARRHIAATVAADSANIRVSPEFMKKLDAYFQEAVFPTVR